MSLKRNYFKLHHLLSVVITRHGSSSFLVAKIFSYKKDDIMSGHGKPIPISHLMITLSKEYQRSSAKCWIISFPRRCPHRLACHQSSLSLQEINSMTSRVSQSLIPTIPEHHPHTPLQHAWRNINFPLIFNGGKERKLAPRRPWTTMTRTFSSLVYGDGGTKTRTFLSWCWRG